MADRPGRRRPDPQRRRGLRGPPRPRPEPRRHGQRRPDDRRRAARSRPLVVTEAVRDATIGGRKVKRGQTIALDPDDGLIASGGDRDKAVLAAIAALTPGYELLTLFYGDGADLTEAEAMARRIGSVTPGVEVEVRHGGQPFYRYLIAAE